MSAMLTSCDGTWVVMSGFLFLAICFFSKNFNLSFDCKILLTRCKNYNRNGHKDSQYFWIALLKSLIHMLKHMSQISDNFIFSSAGRLHLAGSNLHAAGFSTFFKKSSSKFFPLKKRTTFFVVQAVAGYKTCLESLTLFSELISEFISEVHNV